MMKTKSFIVRILVLGAWWCVSLSTFAQDYIDENKMVGFACFYEGRETKVVSRFSKLLFYRRYDKMKQMLTSKNTAEQFMAVLCLERLDSIGRVTITPEEQILFDNIRNSSELVAVCSGCFPNPGIPLKQAFTMDMLWDAPRWLERHIKK
jgi:hypothetical protein